MNERIADLLEQAFDRCKKYDDEGKTGLVKTTEAFHVFAELIISECVEVVKWTPSQFPNDEYIKNIRKHFGLQEPKGWVCPKCGIDRTKEACPNGYHAASTGQCPMIGVAQ